MTKVIEEVLEICLEKIRTGEATIEECTQEFPRYKTELAETLPLIVPLKSLEQIKPSPAFSMNAGVRLASKLPDKSVTFWGLLRRTFTMETVQPIRRFRMIQPIVAVLLAVSMLVASPFAAQATAPGDLFYGLDRGIEQIILRLNKDPDNGILLRMEFATERLEEAEQKLFESEIENALVALRAYNEAIVEIAELMEELPDQNRITIRSMAQEEVALQEGLLTRLRLNWPEDAQSRNAYQKALQRSNMGVEQLFGPPETAPQGPTDVIPQGPNEEAPQGPNDAAPQGPNDAAPQGPNDAAPQGPNEEAPQGPNDAAPQGPSGNAPHTP